MGAPPKFQPEELCLLNSWGTRPGELQRQSDLLTYSESISAGRTQSSDTIPILTNVKQLLELYIQDNYSGPHLTLDTALSDRLSVLRNIFREHVLTPGDGEAFVDNMKNLDYVWIAELMVKRLEIFCNEYPSIHWWLIRAYFLHQRFVEEKSAELWELLQGQINQLEPLVNPDTVGVQLATIFYTELGEIYSFYYDIETAKIFLEKAKKVCGISTNTTGVLGKRTKFQQTKVAQLVLNVELVPVEIQNDGPTSVIFPTVVALDDEDRLDKIQLLDDLNKTPADLSSIHHLVILAEYALIRKYLPHDGVYLEELLAYLNFLIENPKDWAIQLVCLLQRSILEVDNRRTVERSMKQLEVLQKVVTNVTPDLMPRLKYFFGIGMPAKWEIELSLAHVLSSLNLFKEALDISLRLNRWEDVIICYTSLNLRHKAEEVIRQKLETAPTVKLWILLGDATDCPEHYETAWKLSEERSARAQRQWGYFYFVRKEYVKAIPHLQKSIELNPLENPTWIRLGYSALIAEDWSLSTKAYQHSSALDSDNFEIWNNLAHGFVKLNEKKKALRALKEASKCNYENWKVWENTLVVATDCKAFDEVIRAYNRLLDLKGKWSDEQVLELLVRAIVTNMNDSGDQPCRDKYYKETLKLFGRLTSIVTNNSKIWKLYSDLLLIESELESSNTDSYMSWTKGLNFAQKAIEYKLSEPGNLANAFAVIEDTVDFTVEYIRRVKDFQTKYPDTAAETVTNAQFTVRRVFAVIKKRRDSAIVQEGYDQYLEAIKSNAQLLNLHL